MQHTDFITRLIEEKYSGKTVGKIAPHFICGLYDSGGYNDLTSSKDELLFGRLSINTYCHGGQGGYNADIGMYINNDELIQAEAYEDQIFGVGKITHTTNYNDILFNQFYFNFKNSEIKMYFTGYKLTLMDK